MSTPPLAVVTELATVLVVATVLGAACRRWLRTPVVGELVGGILLGPSLVGAGNRDVTQWFSAAGAGFSSVFAAIVSAAAAVLVGVTALQLDLTLVRRETAVIVRVAAAALVLPAALGMAAAAALPPVLHGPRPHQAGFVVFVGVALGVSALPVAAITLRQLGLFKKRIGRLVLAAAAIDDVAGWLLLALMSAVVAGTGGARVAVVVLGVAALVLVPVLGRRAAAALVRTAARSGATASVAVVALVLAAGALIAHGTGLEIPIGAMAAGVLLSRCPAVPARAHRALDRFASRICAPLFLGAAGMRLDVHPFADPAVLVSGAVLLVLAGAGKLAGGYLGARSAGVPHETALATGAGLNARGLVEVLIASIGLRMGLLSDAMYGILIAIAVLTSIATPILLRLVVPDQVAVAGTDEDARADSARPGADRVAPVM